MSDAALPLDVSRETLEALETYSEDVRKWSARINLVSRADRDRIWGRHIVDSAQVFDVAAPKAGKWLDLGSGGGFPGLVVAILARELAPAVRVDLVESDQRKCAFLRQSARSLGLEVKVHSTRIENLDPQEATTISARALAPLDQLLAFIERHGTTATRGIFPKGRRHEDEISEARRSWSFQCRSISSITDPEAAILNIEEVVRA